MFSQEERGRAVELYCSTSMTTQQVVEYLRSGDTLVFRALDRLAGSEVMAIQVVHDLISRGVNIRSLTEPALNIDTSNPMGQAIVGIMAVFAQLRVDTIRENTRRGLAYARAHGRTGGRPTVMGPERTDAALCMKARGESTAHIAAVLGVSPSSVRRALNRAHTKSSSR